MSSPQEKNMPASEEAEQHIIACCLLDGSDTVIRAILAGVTEKSFHWPANAMLWRTISSIHATNPPVTIDALAQELKDQKLLDLVGGFSYLMQVASKIPTTAHASYFIEKLREKEMLRESIKACTLAAEKAYSFSGDMDEFLASHINRMIAIQNGSGGEELTIQSAAENAEAQLTAIMNGEDPKIHSVSFGFPDLDRILSPMMGGEMIVLAARPSVGKTSFSDQIALYNSIKFGRHVAIFSLEEKTDFKPAKMAQVISGHSHRDFKKLDKTSQVEFIDAIVQIKQCDKLHVFYKRQSLTAICARIQSMRAMGKCDLAIIDYLHLMDIQGFKRGDRLAALSEATRVLKLLANDTGIPIMVLSQLNRSSARENREPQLFDLRESGSIEQDADRVLFIHRPDQDPITGCPQDITDETKRLFYQEIIQAKGRSVGTFRCGLYFDRPVTTFKSIKKDVVKG